MDQIHPYAAHFKLWHPAGVQISFGISAEDAADHRQRLDSYLANLLADGYSVQPPSLADDEEVETVDAYVRGETSKGDPCVYLYSARHSLQYKIATVFVERFDELPFSVAEAKTWPGDAAPQRDSAAAKGYLVSVPALEIVLEPTGKTTEAGNPITRFARCRQPAIRQQPAADPVPGELLTDDQVSELEMLAKKHYGKMWQPNLARITKAASANRTERHQSLLRIEAARLITGLTKKINEQAA